MILAAGFGTRLKPLTDKTPKPLLPINGVPLIVYQLKLLHFHGIREVIINLHHLGDQIQEALGDGSSFGLRLHYSVEEKILGTGGGLVKARPFFEDKPVLVLNSDMITDLDLTALLHFHREKKALAVMVLRPDRERLYKTNIVLSESQQILKIDGDNGKKEAPLMYAGIQILSPAFLDLLPKMGKSCVIEDGYRPALKKGNPIFGFRHDGLWKDCGTLEQYRAMDRFFSAQKIVLPYL